MNDLQKSVALQILHAYYDSSVKAPVSVVDLIALAGVESSLGADEKLYKIGYPLGIFQFLSTTIKDIEDRGLVKPCNLEEKLRRDPLADIRCQVRYALAYIKDRHDAWKIDIFGDEFSLALYWQAGGCAKIGFKQALYEFPQSIQDLREQNFSDEFCTLWHRKQDECLKVRSISPCERLKRFRSWHRNVVDFFGGALYGCVDS